jgi:phosphoglycerol transferase MdoB-like AlkP superfamily enzyme
VKILFRIFLLGLLILFISKLIFLFAFGVYDDLQGYLPDLFRAFVMGFRFDVKVLGYGLFPLMLLCFTGFLNSKNPESNGLFNRISLIYGVVILMLFIIISVIDFFYFKFFHTRISVIFFGIIEDDTSAVLKSVWTDYPMILILISLSVIGILLYFVLHKLVRTAVKHSYLQNVWLRVIFVFLFIGIYVLASRGTLEMFPLGAHNSTVSGNTFVNTLTQNGITSLQTAYSDRKVSISTDIAQMLLEYNFDNQEEAVIEYLGKTDIDTINITSNLLSTTPEDLFLKNNPPNVVFLFMESMSSYYYELHSSQTNLFGKLEDQLRCCYVFRNFLSNTNGTISSLESVMVGTPRSPLSQSVYQTRSLLSSVAKPFYDNGYNTYFVTGGKLGWRSLDKFIYNQYFENVEGEATLKKLYPDAKTCEWGVHDENVFDRIYQILSADSQKPRFIFTLTISNHTPFETPKSYSNYPLNVTDEIKSKLKTTPEIAYKNLLSYQYSNNCLGQFIEDLRKSPLGENTIVVATGDHNTLQLFEFTDKDLLRKYSVPFIIYIPEKYKPEGMVNTKRFGSHKDIFPTIFNLSLSNASYLNTGNNMLSEESISDFGVYNYYFAIGSAGCVDFQQNPLYYSWEDSSYTNLIPLGQNHNSGLDSLYLKAKAYIASMNIYIMTDLRSKRVGEH